MIFDEYDFHTAKAGNPISCLKKQISNNFITFKSLQTPQHLILKGSSLAYFGFLLKMFLGSKY